MPDVWHNNDIGRPARTHHKYTRNAKKKKTSELTWAVIESLWFSLLFPRREFVPIFFTVEHVSGCFRPRSRSSYFPKRPVLQCYTVAVSDDYGVIWYFFSFFAPDAKPPTRIAWRDIRPFLCVCFSVLFWFRLTSQPCINISVFDRSFE